MLDAPLFKPYSGKWMVCSIMNNQQQQQQQRQPSSPPSTKNMANPKSRRPSFLNNNLQPSPDFMAGSIEWSVECIRPARECQEDADGPIGEDRAFRNGLQRNVLQLSNLARVNQEKIARLEEQLRSKDEELAALQKQSEKRLSQPVAPEENERPGATVTGKLLKLVSCGNMLGIASRVGVDMQPLGGDLTEENIAAIALGAQQTEQNLIRLNRETRSQLERTVRDAEAYRRDKEATLSAYAVAKREKAKLEARVARLSDELKLQAAALTTLQLEVTNARKETERLKEERKDNRLRQKNAEKVSSEAKQRIENLEFELSETKKAFQRERLRASMLEDISKDSKETAEKDEGELDFCKQVASVEEAHSEQSDAEQHTAASIMRARATEEDNHRLLLGLKQLQRRRGEREALHEHELEAELNRKMIFLRQSQSLRAWLCRAVDELRDAAEMTKLSMTCPQCKKLFRDPHILTPCGHTFCAECCGALDDRHEGGGDGSTREGARETVPNHVVAALLENFAFHRELLDTLKQASVEMWREGMHTTR